MVSYPAFTAARTKTGIFSNGLGIQDVLPKVFWKQKVPPAKGGFATAACMPCCAIVNQASYHNVTVFARVFLFLVFVFLSFLLRRILPVFDKKG